MHKFIFLFFLFLISLAHAQEVTGIVVDEEGERLPFTRILNQTEKLISYCDSTGFYHFEIVGEDSIGFQVVGYPVLWLKQYEVLATHKFDKEQEAVDLDQVNVLDYLPIGNQVISLKKHKGDYFIGIDSLGKEGASFMITHIARPERLFEDCMGNIHIVGRDSAYQILVSEKGINTYVPVEKNEFKANIENCVASFINGFAYQEYSQLNQFYSLKLYTDELKGKEIYNSFDEENFKLVREDYFASEYLTRYLQANPGATIGEVRKLIRDKLGVANPEVLLNFIYPADVSDDWSDLSFWQTNMSKSTFQKSVLTRLRLRPVEVHSIQTGNHIAVISLLDSTVSVINAYGELITKNPITLDKDVDGVWKDAHTGEIYLYVESGFGGYNIFALDIFTGELEFITDLKDFAFAEDFQIYDGWLYYRKLKNGYTKVFRTKIRDPYELRFAKVN